MPRRRKDPILYYETRYGKRSKSSCTKSLPLLASPKLTEKDDQISDYLSLELAFGQVSLWESTGQAISPAITRRWINGNSMQKLKRRLRNLQPSIRGSTFDSSKKNVISSAISDAISINVSKNFTKGETRSWATTSDQFSNFLQHAIGFLNGTGRRVECRITKPTRPQSGGLRNVHRIEYPHIVVSKYGSIVCYLRTTGFILLPMAKNVKNAKRCSPSPEHTLQSPKTINRHRCVKKIFFEKFLKPIFENISNLSRTSNPGADLMYARNTESSAVPAPGYSRTAINEDGIRRMRFVEKGPEFHRGPTNYLQLYFRTCSKCIQASLIGTINVESSNKRLSSSYEGK
ncbi:unnamed protein product [Nesidiocoris tenuis]|uniref:Uncharacterized protein n=1 Tax=Nesidiocoris tenuis TaxID=355587 RepID=A0A6H5G998_9HEMI|nr:unnamed protein product [Nesidiocoris tenuis]